MKDPLKLKDPLNLNDPLKLKDPLNVKDPLKLKDPLNLKDPLYAFCVVQHAACAVMRGSSCCVYQTYTTQLHVVEVKSWCASCIKTILSEAKLQK